MTMAFARSQYRRTEDTAVRDVDDPHHIILITMRELEKSLRILDAAKKAGVAYADRSMTRSFTALYILQSSLDFERGGEMATSLFRVYEYCRQQVTLAFRRDDSAALDKAAEAISGLVDAWSRIAPQKQAVNS